MGKASWGVPRTEKPEGQGIAPMSRQTASTIIIDASPTGAHIEITPAKGTQGTGETDLVSKELKTTETQTHPAQDPDEPTLWPAAGDTFYRFRRAAPAVLASAYAKLLLRLFVDRKFDFSEILLASETGLPIREVEQTMPELIEDGFVEQFDRKGQRYYHLAPTQVNRVAERLKERAST